VKTILVSLAAVLLLCGCAGTYFTFDKAREVKAGMTEDELQKIMGRPYMVSSVGSREIWVYTFATGFGSARSVSYVLTDGKVIETPKIPASFDAHTSSGITTAAP